MALVNVTVALDANRPPNHLAHNKCLYKYHGGTLAWPDLTLSSLGRPNLHRPSAPCGIPHAARHKPQAAQNLLGPTHDHHPTCPDVVSHGTSPCSQYARSCATTDSCIHQKAPRERQSETRTFLWNQPHPTILKQHDLRGTPTLLAKNKDLCTQIAPDEQYAVEGTALGSLSSVVPFQIRF